MEQKSPLLLKLEKSKPITLNDIIEQGNWFMDVAESGYKGFRDGISLVLKKYEGILEKYF